MSDIADLLASLTPEAREVYLNGPAHVPPDGVVPNFENPGNRNSLAIAVVAAGLVIASSLFFVKVYAQVFCFKKVHIEDGLVLAGFVRYNYTLQRRLVPLLRRDTITDRGIFQGFYIAYTWCVLAAVRECGAFVHQWDVRLMDLAPFLYIVHLGVNFYEMTHLLLKPAIILEWCRTFVPFGKRNAFWWTCHVLLWLNVLFYGSLRFATNLTCRPYAKTWDKTIQGKCLNEGVIWVASSCLNLVSDLVILALPHGVIWKLNLSTAKKIGVSIVFAFGIFACVGASLRIYAGAQYLASDDSTYIIATITMACWTEMVLLFVVACVPSLPRVAIRLGFPKVVSSLVSCALSYSGVNNLTKRMATSRTQPGNEPAAGRNSTYHELEDYSRTTLTLARDGRGEVDSMFPPQAHLPPPEGQIIRTTHITATEDYNTPNNDASLSSYQHQHPWTAQDWPREERQIV